MGDKKVNLELEWPSFQNNDDNRITYSPDSEAEDIFTNFKPATETHIRNKKRKPRKQKPKSLRLISESEINDKDRACCRDRCRCLVISILVLCIIIIAGVCIFLGVYFGVIVKGTNDPQTGQIQAEDTGSTSPGKYTSSKTTLKPLPTTVKSTSVTLSRLLSSSSSSSSTSTSTTTSTTSTTSTSTTTTTTTTTTPLPTAPPVREYNGSDEDNQSIIGTASKCVEDIIFRTDGLSNEEKCDLYREVMRCAYIQLVSLQLYVPVDTLTVIVETNWNSVFKVWMDIQPDTCKDDDGSLTFKNLSSLPRDLKDLCSSADAIVLHAKHDCKVAGYNGADMSAETDEAKCRILWGTLGCVAEKLTCEYDVITDFVRNYSTVLLKPTQLDFVNLSSCQEMYADISSQSPCVSMLYTYMVPVYYKCSLAIQQGSLIAKSSPDMTCTLFEAFFGCSYGQIPELTQYETCNKERDSLRQISYDIALEASKVNQAPPFSNVTSCISTPLLATFICKEPKKLLTVIDTHCYKKFRPVTSDTVCKYLREYIFDCAPSYLEDLGMTCSVEDIKTAVVDQGDLIFTYYGIEVAGQRQCIESYSTAPP